MSDGIARFKRMAGGFLAVAVGTYGAMALAFVISAVLTRRLGAERFGGLALLMMASQVLSLFVSNWTHVGFVGFGSQEFAAAGTVTGTFWARTWVVAPWATAGTIVMILFREPLAAYFGIPVWGLAIVYGHFAAAYALTSLGAVFQARHEMSRYGTALFLDKAATLALVGLLPAAWVGTPLRVVGAYALSSALVCGWCAWILGRSAFFPIRFDREAFRRIWRFSLPLIFSTWSGLLGTSWFDYFVIRRYLPLSDLGLYSLASQLNGVIQQITVIFSTLLLPHLAAMVHRGEDARIRAIVERFFPYWFLGTSVLFSVVLLSARPVLPLVFGEAFSGAARPLAILMLATSAMTFFNAFTPLVSAYGLTWQFAIMCVVSVLVNVVMDFALIPSFGIEGAATATVIAYGIAAVLVLELVRRRLGCRIFQMGALGVPMLVVCLSFLLLDDARFYVVGAVGAAASACVLVRVFGLFNEEDRTFLQDLRMVPALHHLLMRQSARRGLP
ncbi:MAG: polysaccharide biosynthesis C-terminal domain-containing protein [candidate division NC10 bacterium]|nr:polysaccharide biosynthesis C-terminal domain-containing protein [candidate division NC10 bacterium]